MTNPTNSEEPKELPEWLKVINEMPACKYCGLIAGKCLVETLGGECKRREYDDE